MKKYTIEYGNPDIHMKRVYFDSLEVADRHFKIYKRFAEKKKSNMGDIHVGK